MKNKQEKETLDEFLANRVFKGAVGTTVDPKPTDVAGFDEFIKRYTSGLCIERAAVDALK